MEAIKNKIESLLFISHKPLAIGEIAKINSIDASEAEKILEELYAQYQERNSGIVILKNNNKYQMATAGDSSEVISEFIKAEITGELTKPSLEALTIIAYRGPVSKAELELIRGVNCGLILRNLLMRGLIEAKEDKSREITVYSVTFEFLKYLGITKVEELPDFESLNRNNNLEKLLEGIVGSSEENVSETITIDNNELKND